MRERERECVCVRVKFVIRDKTRSTAARNLTLHVLTLHVPTEIPKVIVLGPPGVGKATLVRISCSQIAVQSTILY